MATLKWDQAGERRFETGVDRGVLFLSDGRAVVWNGLTSVEESSDRETQPFYLDGVKYLERQIPSDYAGSLAAYTYPDEFDEINGVRTIGPGFSVHDQPAKSFGLSYRTKIGNDLEGENYGYKIHIIYNVLATPNANSFTAMGEAVEATEFGWTLSATPETIAGFRPTAHLSFDSTKVDSGIMEALEIILYGTDDEDPRLPTVQELLDISAIIITDNGDGTWTATSTGPEADNLIVMRGNTIFEINHANATFLDADTYTISTSIPD